MRAVHVAYRQEDGGGWSAVSPEAPGWTAFAESFDEIVKLAQEGLPFFLGEGATIISATVDLGANWTVAWNGAITQTPMVPAYGPSSADPVIHNPPLTVSEQTVAEPVS
jgi:predicted RNase H-like HicB family nuclease